MTLDIGQQVTYWKNSALEDWDATLDIFGTGNLRPALFWLHLSLEKLLKAQVWQYTQAAPPRSHSLPALADLGQIALLSGYQAHYGDTLIQLNRFNMETRYPAEFLPLPDASIAQTYLDNAKEIIEWLAPML